MSSNPPHTKRRNHVARIERIVPVPINHGHNMSAISENEVSPRMIAGKVPNCVTFRAFIRHRIQTKAMIYKPSYPDVICVHRVKSPPAFFGDFSMSLKPVHIHHFCHGAYHAIICHSSLWVWVVINIHRSVLHTQNLITRQILKQ